MVFFRDARWIHHPWTIGQAAALACSLEASAPKVGNVHPQANFSDMYFVDFLASAMAIEPIFARAESLGVGELVLQAVKATRESVGLNTNLGTLILLAPLAKAAATSEHSCVPIPDGTEGTTKPKISHTSLLTNLRCMLEELTPLDAELLYQAIRLANPGGLGEQPHNDVAQPPPSDLLAAMAQVSHFDAVARQYGNCFEDILARIAPAIVEQLAAGLDILQAIAHAQIMWLAREPDGLIVRKAGLKLAQQVQQLAQVYAATESSSQIRTAAAKSELDSFLRADSKHRNPGTTADLIAAALFVVLICK